MPFKLPLQNCKSDVIRDEISVSHHIKHPALFSGLLFQRLFQTKVAFQVKTSRVYGRVDVCGCPRVGNVHCVHVPRVAKSVHCVQDDVGGVITGLGDEGSGAHLSLLLPFLPFFFSFKQ